MNIFGNGVDIIKNERIKKSIKNILAYSEKIIKLDMT